MCEASTGNVSTPRICLITMGCAKNEVDSADMARRLAQAGFNVESDAEEADVIIVNTCSFIQSATEESLDAIFEAARLPRVETGDAAIVVAGCMPARYGDDLSVELTEAAAFVPCSREDDIVAIVKDLVGGSPGDLKPSLTDYVPQPFAYVKISDGCDRFCSYCTIPYIRGRYHSFSYGEIRAEVLRLVQEHRTQEIVLIAQDTGRWGQDLSGKQSLATLLDDLAGEFPQVWFRVMYLQPEGVTDDLLQVMAARENVCSYLDIPLQHVSAPLLRAMNRSGSAEEYLSMIDHIRELVSDVTLRTTFIAGFPGETEEQFEELCAFVEEAPFDYVGVFPYSREEGTRAYDLEGQIDEDEKMERAQILRDTADAVCAVRVARRIGSEMEVLVEGYEEDGQRFGRAQCQAPEVDGVTYINAGEPGDIVSVAITGTLMYEMEGTLRP